MIAAAITAGPDIDSAGDGNGLERFFTKGMISCLRMEIHNEVNLHSITSVKPSTEIVFNFACHLSKTVWSPETVL